MRGGEGRVNPVREDNGKSNESRISSPPGGLLPCSRQLPKVGMPECAQRGSASVGGRRGECQWYQREDDAKRVASPSRGGRGIKSLRG